MSGGSFFYNLQYFQQLIRSAFRDANDAYNALMNHEGDISYVIASNFLTLSHQSYIELKRFNHEQELDHLEIDSFFKAYEDYIFQLKQVIVDKDENTSWLYSTHNQLTESWKSANEFLSNAIIENSTSSR